MTYLTDTQRVEMILPPQMMLAVLLAGANCADPGPLPVARTREESARLPITISHWRQAWAAHQKRVETDPEFARAYEEFLKTKELLVEACDEPLRDVYPEKKKLKLLSRVERVHERIVEPYVRVQDPDPRKIGLIAYYLIQELVSQEYLIIPEDTAFGKALDIMLPALSPWEGNTHEELLDYERLNKSAQKQFRHIMSKLKQEGYYLGLIVTKEAA